MPHYNARSHHEVRLAKRSKLSSGGLLCLKCLRNEVVNNNGSRSHVCDRANFAFSKRNRAALSLNAAPSQPLGGPCGLLGSSENQSRHLISVRVRSTRSESDRSGGSAC